MKLKLRVKSKLLIFILTFTVIMVLGVNITYSEDSINVLNENNSDENDISLEVVEYSEGYKKWLALPEEERTYSSMPFQYDVKYTSNKFDFKSMLLGAILPERFDLRDIIPINVKDQGSTMFCWAFGATSTVETHLAMKNKEYVTYSPRHLDYSTARDFLDGINEDGVNRSVNDGGHIKIAMTYYANGHGPVKEEDMPFTNSVEKLPLEAIKNKEQQKQIKETVYFPTIFKKREGNEIKYLNGWMNGSGSELSEQQVTDIRSKVKAHIMEYGGVGITYNNASSIPGDTTNAYVANTDNDTFHDVIIVGWDDNYSKDNFRVTPAPLHDGAWICLNSWGTDCGENGFFYISYDDAYVEARVYGFKEITDVDYDNVYKHDYFMPNYGVRLTNSDKNVYTANVFTKDPDKKEYVTQVGISNDIQETTIDIYVDPTGELDADKFQLVQSDVKLPIGYKTYEFDPVDIDGEKFAIVVKYKEKTEVSVERNDDNYNFYATANDGEGFCSLDGERWSDINKLMSNTSFTIKAFTVDEPTNGEDKIKPKIKFEPDGDVTPSVTHKTKVTVTDNVEVDEDSIKYVWTMSEEQPADDSFTNSCTNGEEIIGNYEKGTYYLWVVAQDTSGNKGYAHSKAFYFDNDIYPAPTITADVAQNVYTKEDVTITITDTSGKSGLVGYQYSLDNGATWIDYRDRSWTLKNTGVYNVIARSVWPNEKYSDISLPYVIKIDKDLPPIPKISATVKDGGETKENVTVTISGGATPSGVKKYQYKLRDTDWIDVDSSNKFEISRPGVHYITARAINNVDSIGNPTSEYLVKIVKGEILINFEPNGNPEYSKKAEVYVTLAGVDTITESKYLWSTKSEGITKDNFVENFRDKDTIRKDTGSGDWYLWVYVSDSAGNTMIKRSEAFKLDNDVPTAPKITKTEDSKKGTVTLEFSGSQALCGIAKYQYTMDDGSAWTDVIAEQGKPFVLVIDREGEYNVKARAVNKLGTYGLISDNFKVEFEKNNNGNNNNNNGNNNGNNGNNNGNNNNNNNNNNGNNNGNNSGNNSNKGNNNSNKNTLNSGSSQNSSGAQNNSKNSGTTIGSTKYDGNIPNTGLDFARLVAAFTVAIVVTALTIIGMTVKERIDK